MTQMKAVGIFDHYPVSDPDSLQDILVEKPTPTGSDLLVEVKAISVNPIDTKIRMRPLPENESYPKILGWDVSGIVREAGDCCTLFDVGDEVFYSGSISRPGANSQYHLVDERIVGRKPKSLSFPEAAALPLTSITAWEALFDRLQLPDDPQQNKGKTLLIIGAAGGVGSIATQLAKSVGLTVICTASRPLSKQWCMQQGASKVIDHHQPLASQLQALKCTHVDLILCLYQTDFYWEQMAEVIAPQGKICSVVDASTSIDLNLLKNKSVTFVWEFMFTRPLFQTDDLITQHHILTHIADGIEKGILKTTMQEQLGKINANQLRLAHQKIESGRTIGKLVLAGFES